MTFPPFEGDDDLIGWLSKPIYAPRPKRTPIPAARWDDCPAYCLQVNDEWLGHLLGVIDALDQADTWLGTPAQIQNAREQVREMIAAFMGDAPMKCCCDSQTVTNTQFTPDGTMQVSYDGGITWVDAPPGVDPRYSGSIGQPIPGADGNEKRCKAAGSASEAMRDRQEQMSADAALGGGIAGAIGALITLLLFIGIIGSAGALTPLILAFAAGLTAAGQAAFDAAFNDAVWSIVQCAIYCQTKPDAPPYTKADIDAIRAKIASQLTGVAAFFVDQTLQIWGATGLTNASRAGFVSPIDCTTCECPDCLFDYDFRISSHQFSLSAHRGTWVSGQGWESTDLTVDTFNYYTCMVEVTIPDGCTTPFLHWELFYADVSGVPGAQVLGKYQFLQDDGTGNIVWIDNGWNNGGATNTEHSTTIGTPGYLGTTFYGVRIQITNLGINGGSFIRRLQLKATNP